MGMLLGQQIKNNAVALISLVVALAGLSYNTWRNEVTEANRNIRFAGFEMLLKLGELQQVIFYSHYDKDLKQGNPRRGWTYILVMDDLSQLMPEPVPQQAQALHQTWQDNWEGLGQDQAKVEKINQSIDRVRLAVQQVLHDLE